LPKEQLKRATIYILPFEASKFAHTMMTYSINAHKGEADNEDG